MSSKKNLVIVESPAKARTIAGYLGKDFTVKSSMGHLRDLPSKGLGVDVTQNFTPTYETDPGKADIVRELKKAAKDATVWLATDEDREGEAIAWHLCEILGIGSDTAKRIVFHEITKPAITAAIDKPRQLDMNLVDSQQARRILDRLVGYELSPVLWKKIKIGLSAGRVQSVAVRLLVEREKEIRAHKAEPSFKITGSFKSGTDSFTAELNKRLATVDETRGFLDDNKKAGYKVVDAKQKPGTRNPSAPFTTSTLQQEASSKLGFGVRQTMRLAQRLYEAGHITYMRTDSTILSQTAISAAKKYITNNYGANYAREKQYQTKSNSAQEAHEAIRPSRLDRLEAGDDNQQKKLYRLIWQRTLASQMAPAQVELSEIHINISTRDEIFIAKGQVLVFDGFMKVYTSPREDTILPKIKTGDSVELDLLRAEQIFSRAPSRYSEAALVRKLEELGIGRPSTYAPTISTIQDRGYVEKKDLEGEPVKAIVLTLSGGTVKEETKEVMIGADKKKLIPTELAEIVTDFLVKYFQDVMDYGFTASAEAELDQIADGKLSWQKMLETFYKKFHPFVERSQEASRKEASGAKELGIHPKLKEPITARLGRFGPVLQMGEADKEKGIKPRFAPLPRGVRIEDVTLEQAIPMFELPRTVGQTDEGKPILADIGRYGPYLKLDDKFISIKGLDPLTITEAEAKKVITEHAKTQAKKVIADFGQIKVLNGPYGPYVTNGKINIRVPKNVKAEKLTEKDAVKLLDNPPPKKGKWRK